MTEEDAADYKKSAFDKLVDYHFVVAKSEKKIEGTKCQGCGHIMTGVVGPTRANNSVGLCNNCGHIFILQDGQVISPSEEKIQELAKNEKLIEIQSAIRMGKMWSLG